MNTKKIIYFAVAVILLIAVFVVWKKTSRNELILDNQPLPQFLFVKKTNGEFALEERQKIEEFKAKFLARARLGVKLTEQERAIFSVVMFDREAMLPNGNIVANQSVLKFSAEEMGLISNALKK